MQIFLNLVLAFILVLLNGFFVAAEFALVKVRATRIDELVASGSATAAMAQRQVRHLDAYLSATQLGITIASIGLGWIGEPALASILEPIAHAAHLPEGLIHPVSFIIAFSIISALHIVIGELAPKSWAIQRPEQVSLALSYPLHFFYWVFRPAIVVLNGIAGALLRRLGIEPAGEHELAHTEEELRMILTASGRHGVLKASEVDLVHHVFEFANRVARDVMVPRVDMVYLDATWPLSRNLDRVAANTFTRYPLCEGSPDRVIGMIHVRSLLPLAGLSEADLRELARPVPAVPETKSIDKLLREFQQENNHMAIVLDEYGGTAGLVTLEDIIEEIVGEIHDEFEKPEVEVEASADGRLLLVEGRTLLAELRFTHDVDLPVADSENVGGWVLEQFGDIPEPGDRLVVQGFEITVAEMDGQRVRRVEIRRTARSTGDDVESANENGGH